MSNKYIFIIVIIILSVSTTSAQIVADYKSIINNNHITIHVDSTQMKYSFNVKKVNFKPSSKFIYHWYASGNIIKNQGNYSGKVLHGDFKSFHSNKILAEKGQYYHGLKKGIWLLWDRDGILISSQVWKNGFENGEYFLYDSKGNIREQGKNIYGNKQGKIYIIDTLTNTYLPKYYNDGEVISKEEYINQSIWRRSGKFIQNKWQGLFRKNQVDSVANLAPQLFN